MWAQLITNDTIVLSPVNGGANETCHPLTQPVATTGTGLDTQYPYSTAASTNDNPSVGLDSTADKEVNRAFNATMYLMWTSGLTSAIPVPLGSVSWTFSGDATFNSTTGVWSVVSGSSSASPFVASSSYATWSSFVPYQGSLICQ